ncbi:hypothetical protein OSH77_21290, partial [Mycobacterium ulcerans]
MPRAVLAGAAKPRLRRPEYLSAQSPDGAPELCLNLDRRLAGVRGAHVWCDRGPGHLDGGR